jgi:hypothetical protein
VGNVLQQRPALSLSHLAAAAAVQVVMMGVWHMHICCRQNSFQYVDRQHSCNMLPCFRLLASSLSSARAAASLHTSVMRPKSSTAMRPSGVRIKLPAGEPPKSGAAHCWGKGDLGLALFLGVYVCVVFGLRLGVEAINLM